MYILNHTYFKYVTKCKRQTWPILTLSAAWNCSSVTKSRIISPFQVYCDLFCISSILLSLFFFLCQRASLFLFETKQKNENPNFESQSCAILRKKWVSLSPFAPLISLFHSFIKREKSRAKRERMKWARERLKLEADYEVVDGTEGHYSFRTMTGQTDSWEMDF